MFKQLIIICSLIGFVGCSSAPEEADIDTNQQAIIIGVGNGITSLPANRFCYPVEIRGTNAHSQAPLENGWNPQFGGYWRVDNANNTLTALPNVNTNPGAPAGSAGTFEASVNCVTYDTFKATGNFTGPFGFSPPFIYWGQDRGIPEWHYEGGIVSPSAGLLWDTKSACWISGTHGFSDPAETAYLDKYTPPGSFTTNWRLNVAAFPQDQEHFQCAWVGHNITGITPFYQATPGNSTQMSAAADWTCLINKIRGNLDNGYVLMNKTSNGLFWRLEAGGSVAEASAYCFPNKTNL